MGAAGGGIMTNELRNHVVRGSDRMKRLDADVTFFLDRAKGKYATATTCTDPDRFIDAVGWELPVALNNIGTRTESGAAELIGQICELWAKLKGYKAEHVYEERRLVVGMPSPENSMVCLNYVVNQAQHVTHLTGIDEDGLNVYNHPDGSDCTEPEYLDDRHGSAEWAEREVRREKDSA